MSNLAAVIPEAKARLVVQDVGIYSPGPHELVVKNEVIAFNPVEYKAAQYAMLPLEYPAIIGSSYGGVVHSVGSEVTFFKVGDKVAVGKGMTFSANKYGSFQQYVITEEKWASKVAPGVTVEAATSFTGNLPTIAGLFSGRLGLEKPALEGTATAKNEKILVYGGSSSVGSLSVQYVAQAGYTVITTSSPRNHAFVSKLGATKIIDHTQTEDAVIKALVAEGPYDWIVDSITLDATLAITGAVVSAQGGGKLYALLPSFGPEVLPANVTRAFEPWPAPLEEEANQGLTEWAFHEYLTKALGSGRIIPSPIQKVDGGLKNINTALDILAKGVSGVKLILDPWA